MKWAGLTKLRELKQGVLVRAKELLKRNAERNTVSGDRSLLASHVPMSPCATLVPDGLTGHTIGAIPWIFILYHSHLSPRDRPSSGLPILGFLGRDPIDLHTLGAPRLLPDFNSSDTASHVFCPAPVMVW